MFDQGMYRCDNNKDQHFIDSIVHKKNNIADGDVHVMRERSFIRELNRTTPIYQLNSKTLQHSKVIQIIRTLYTIDIIVDNI